MSKVTNSTTTKRLVASGIMLFGGFLTFVNKPQDVHAEDGTAPVKETNTTATESSNVAVLKSSVKSNSESGSKVATSDKTSEVTTDKSSSKTTKTEETAAEPAPVAGISDTESSTAPAATPAPASPSTEQEMSKTVTLDGKTYKFTGKANTTFSPLFTNKVENVTDGSTHTYSYNLGTGQTGGYYMRDASGKYIQLAGFSPSDPLTNITEVTTEKTANTLSKTFTTYDGKIKVKESITFTDSAMVEHTLTVTNLGHTSLNNYSFGAMLDTMLDSNDSIAIYSSGNGGAFLKNEFLTLYATGVKNANVYAGGWEGGPYDISSRKHVTGNYGANLVQNMDSAIQYETGKINLAPGASYTFKFGERLHTGKQELGKLTVRYVDTKGKSLREDQVLGNVVGENYTITPDRIDGYTFKNSNSSLTGTYTEADQTLTLVYQANELPKTKTDSTTPTKKTPAPTRVTAPQSNKALPQTGEKSGITASVIGVGILATLSLFGFAKLRKRENN